MAASFLQRGGGWVLGQGVLMLAVALLAIVFHGHWTKLAIVVGAVLLFVGGAVGLAGAIVLGRNLTPFPKPIDQSPLVQQGVYALMRHPLYTSVVLAAVGWALLWQSWPALAAALVLVPFLDAKASQEERWLMEKSPEYAEYQKRVRRFIPWVY